jgi:crotonobetainyl-CoA:carnitine CoA-transferase CaiB-like acyl-CoA transferase
VLVPMLRQALQQRTALEWERLFAIRVPCAAIRGIEDMFDHPQVRAEQLVTTHEHPTLGSYRTMTGPVRMNQGRGDAPDRRAPVLGEHTDEVLAEHGFSAGEIAALRAAQAVH